MVRSAGHRSWVYYRNQTTWHNGPMPSGCNTAQDDLAIITNSTNGFGYRTDENSDFTNASPITMDGTALQANGIITTNTDTDIFSMRLDKSSLLQLKVAPYSIAAGDQGSNLDVEVNLYNAGRELIDTYNPSNTLSVAIDTLLNAGEYYVSVSGVGNAYASDYASLGLYLISGSISNPEPLPLHKLLLKGIRSGSQHHLAWEIEADEKVVQQTIEVANSSSQFTRLSQPAAEERTFQHLPAHAGVQQYRLQVTFDNGRQYYSNIIALRNASGKPQLLTNVITSGQLMVQSDEKFQFIISDIAGRIMSKGQVTEGTTSIQTGHLGSGIYLIRFSNGTDSFVEKFTRQ